ncbi:MAG: aminotransferase class III-fold pyridoxal phosphate-dependent enzyme [Gammaproteobacteria bacterium]|nr:aminotransferase class III-fold pyridoxal phosphate-dependent enzyme [Gammaproteobacteria bacterium]
MTTALSRLLESERAAFVARRPRSRALAERSRAHWLSGVPMHWMTDWGTPHPMFVAHVEGVTLTDVDGLRYTDFCLGDTGSMFGHSPPAVSEAIGLQSARGLTCMLPDERVATVGEQLARRFGWPFWQVMQTATDANRAALRWARALTQRSKIMVYQGCYHGIVEETMVRRRAGRTVMREGAIGSALDYSQASVAIEFNDVAALEQALRAGDIAAVIAEPVMTNIGMVLPALGYLETLQSLCQRHGTLLIIDETHTLSSGPGGYAGTHQLSGDFWVCGKAIAGGLPCAVLGFTAEVEARMQCVLASRAGGHSGMGTTLAANPLVFAALEASLAHLHTETTHAAMQAAATRLEQGLLKVFAVHNLDWHVSCVGARIEFGFGPAPRNGSEAEAAMRPEFEHTLHLWLLNRGLLVTPFHNMMLTAPMLQASQVEALCTSIESFLDAVIVSEQPQ